MSEFRLNFDDPIFDALTQKITKRANGGSLNKALKTMIIEWSAIEDARNTSKTGRETAIIQKNQLGKDELSNSLASLADEWAE